MGSITFSGPNKEERIKLEVKYRLEIGTFEKLEGDTVYFKEVVNPYPKTLIDNYRGD